MSEATEKITINIGVVDLGKIDILVDQGFYANRTDFIKDSIRRNLDVHADDVKRTLDRARAESEDGAGRRGDENIDQEYSVSGGIGILGFSRSILERLKNDHKRIRIICAGLVVFTADVTPDLIDETIESFKVFGTVRASDAVRAALKKKEPRV